MVGRITRTFVKKKPVGTQTATTQRSQTTTTRTTPHRTTHTRRDAGDRLNIEAASRAFYASVRKVWEAGGSNKKVDFPYDMTGYLMGERVHTLKVRDARTKDIVAFLTFRSSRNLDIRFVRHDPFLHHVVNDLMRNYTAKLSFYSGELVVELAPK